ncbi:MAG: helix-turn-helix transcriptional regulator [Sphingopyxis sp.]|nr:helix-turn-helix transcriptional regulator [Sphingopyxis sp.]
MSTRNYNQNCALARASDLLGERWTLLIIRDLLIAPRRFRELEQRLRNMGTNLLAKRLKDMQRAGLLSGGESRSPYCLTDMGRALEPMVLHLARWSLKWVPSPLMPSAVHYPDWDLLALKSLFVPDPKMRSPLLARFEAGDWIAWVKVDRHGYTYGLGEPNGIADIDFSCNVSDLRNADSIIPTMKPTMRQKAERLLSCFPLN